MTRHSIQLAGKEYELVYTPREERAILRRTGYKRLYQVLTEGGLEEQAVVVWAGMLHTNRKLQPDDVIELFSRHVEDPDRGPYQDVVAQAYLAVARSKLLGTVHERVLMRILSEHLGVLPPEESQEPGVEEAGGKDPMMA